MFETYIFGSVVAGSYQELIVMMLAVTAVLFVVAIPFIIVWRFIKLFIGG